MGFYGADTEQLREHAEAVRLGEQSLAELFESLDSVVRTVSWDGPDAEGFRSQWGSLISGSARTYATASVAGPKRLIAKPTSRTAQARRRGEPACPGGPCRCRGTGC